ncbi:MerR-like DNA binding protein [Kribbella orskensis]|uniref:MerR-like DNA binding protein n=1 Tax=Kribbella orskensis TaxID=2512216 RepID=A0ABY2BQZ6_9ACTN|nr:MULTISPECIES: MerR family transcriptional regulator [Kribbella]TCN37316.1 MerR-like DNA binding protein [Kribbella sp. VKM Ac-2500]TCO27776.1 MerR-like DNA binding protein [Kribbella orskensis]
MRIAELSRVSGVPVPTIKYYLREGLLPAGELTSPNQADYGDQHLHRLRLIRALVDLGEVPVAGVKRIIEALNSDSLSLHDQIGRAHRAITPQPQLTASTEVRAEAAAQVDELVRSRGWTIDPDAPALTTLIETVAAFRTLDQDHLAGFLDSYADAVEKFTELEVAAVTSRADRTTPDQIAESVVIGTILGETLISTLRLLAQESISAQRWKVD